MHRFDHDSSFFLLELLFVRLGASISVALLAAFGLSALASTFFILRRTRGIPRFSKPTHRSLQTDLGYVLMAPITDVLSRTLTTLGVAACAVLLGRHLGRDLLEGFGPVVQQPRWLVVVEMLVLSDFIYYWTHRLAHTVPALWRLHAIHHSTKHLRWTSALRAHPAEVYVHLLNMLPLFMLGFPVDALAPLAPVVALYAFVIHCDVHITLRPLSYVLNIRSASTTRTCRIPG